MDATLLGTGDAFGIPRPGCRCAQCDEARADARCARTRSGVLLRSGGEVVLLDCSPDILRQLDAASVRSDQITRVIISHQHNDHCYGIHDLVRTRSPDAPPLLVNAGAGTQEVLQRAFPSLFRPGRQVLAFEPWGHGLSIALEDVTLTGLETTHVADIETTAFELWFPRGGVTHRVIHATDMGASMAPEDGPWKHLSLFLGDGTYLGAGGKGHPGTDRVLEIAAAFGAAKVAITHVGHWGVTMAEAAERLGPDVAICRDGDALASFL